MAQILTPATLPTTDSPLVLHDISWEMYEKLLEVFAEHPSLRMTYYKGTLELMTPLPEHETYGWTLGRLVAALSEELGLEIRGLKSTTWRSKPKTAGKEADECFYIQNEAVVRGRDKLDLTVDPPPDLALEIDVTSRTHPSIYEALAVPELWRFEKGKLQINVLQKGKYIESTSSPTFPNFPLQQVIPEYLQQCKTVGRNKTMRAFRAWVRETISKKI